MRDSKNGRTLVISMKYFCDVIYKDARREFYEVPEGEDPDTFIKHRPNIEHVQIIHVEDNAVFKCEAKACPREKTCIHASEHIISTKCFVKSTADYSPCNQHYCRKIKIKKSFEF